MNYEMFITDKNDKKYNIKLIRKINNGDFYLHFKNELNKEEPITKYLYIIKEIAINASNNVKEVSNFVIYKNILTGKVYARDINEFMSFIDVKKYSNIKQKFRFAKCDALGNIIGGGE